MGECRLPVVSSRSADAAEARIYCRPREPSGSISPCLSHNPSVQSRLSSNHASSAQMTSRPMRKLPRVALRLSPAYRWPCKPASIRGLQTRRHKSAITGSHALRQISPKRYLAQVRPEPISEVWFTASFPRSGPADELLGSSSSGGPNGPDDHKPPDERLLKLGKSTFEMYDC
jgi:hypothetical protein